MIADGHFNLPQGFVWVCMGGQAQKVRKICQHPEVARQGLTHYLYRIYHFGYGQVKVDYTCPCGKLHVGIISALLLTSEIPDGQIVFRWNLSV